MILSKTSWRIRQLVSHKQDESLQVEVEEASSLGEEKAAKRQSRTQSWISQPRKSTDDSALRRTYNSSNSQNLPPLSNSKTANSSASSLCSCNYDAIATPMADSLSQLDPHIPTPNILYLEAVDSLPSSGDAKKWQKIFEAPNAEPTPALIISQTATSTISFDSTFDLLQALSFESVEEDDGEKTPTQDNPQTMSGKAENGWSSNVEQLIQETDEAFRSAEFALADAKAATQEWHPNNDAITNETLPSRDILRKQHEPPVARAASVSKPKRKKLENHMSRSLKSPNAPQPTPTPSPRWTLTDGMAEIFTGKIFNRGFSGENSAVEKVQKLEIERTSEAEATSSLEISHSGSSDEHTALIEPFHLQDLPSRIGAAGLGLPLEAAANAHPLTPPIPERNLQKYKVNNVDYTNDRNDLIELQFHDLIFPSPPRTAQTSPRGYSNQPPVLPTIPETSPLSPIQLKRRQYSLSPIAPSTPQNPVVKRHSRSTGSRRKRTVQSASTTVLESTPQSLTSIGFRNGSIRLNRHQNERHASDAPSRASDISITCGISNTPHLERNRDGGRITHVRKGSNASLDWTAFQMAISGGAGDYLMGEDLTSHMRTEEIEREIDDIVGWWTGFGMGIGGLEKEDPTLQKKRITREDSGPGVGAATLPTGYATESRHWEQRREWGASKLELSTVNSRRELVLGDSSFPSSPMEDLNSEGLVRKGSVAPMGFNLGHDLGDFLKWENERVGSEV